MVLLIFKIWHKNADLSSNAVGYFMKICCYQNNKREQKRYRSQIDLYTSLIDILAGYYPDIQHRLGIRVLQSLFLVMADDESFLYGNDEVENASDLATGPTPTEVTAEISLNKLSPSKMK